MKPLRKGLLLFILILFPTTGFAGINDGLAALERDDFATAYAELKRVAEEGDLDAQFELGQLYEKGMGVSKSYTEAAAWYRRAAEQGHPRAQLNLGLLLTLTPSELGSFFFWFTIEGEIQYFVRIEEIDDKGFVGDEDEGTDWIRASAQQGYAPAELELGLRYASGFGLTEDMSAAVQWFRKAADQGHAEAAHRLSEHYAEGLGVEKSGVDAIRWLKRAAEAGHVAAQNELAFRYLQGDGVVQDLTEAAQWLRLAAEQGNAWAQFNLGLMYARGQGVPKNDAEAARWYRLAAEQGYAPAQTNLGLMYNEGRGMSQDHTEAARWYRLAAEQGDAWAQFNLGVTLGEGHGVPRNAAEAVRWYRLAAEQGHATAQNNLGSSYDRGEGVPQDSAEALRWYRLAAEQGLAVGQANVGAMYRHGRGVPKNDAEAARWLQRSADQGNADAQASLGYMYGDGLGVVRNYVLAYKWTSLAAAQGNEIARRNLRSFEHSMTREQIAEAQRLAAAFHARSQVDWSQFEPVDIRLEQDTPNGPRTEETRMSEERAKPKLDSTGTAFFVNRTGHLLTNHHVVDGCAQVRVVLPTGSSDARVVSSAADEDLAALRIMGEVPSGVASFRRTSAALGEDVIVAGYPLRGVLGDDLNVTTGSVSALVGMGDDRRLLQITAPVQPGNSGGPLLDASGQVIGVVIGKLDAVAIAKITGDIPQNVNFAIKGAVARAFLAIHDLDYVEGARDQEELSRAAVAARARAFTVPVECWK